MGRCAVRFDPRTKLLLLVTMAIFVLGGTGGDIFGEYIPYFALLPFILFILSGRLKKTIGYMLLYGVFYGLAIYVLPYVSGVIGFLLLAFCSIMTRFLPGIMAGTYMTETTTVSEFSAAMGRMHVSDKLTIPLLAMFRFFPTIGDEFRSINDAMRMRDIRFGGRNVSKMVEYRIVPLLICSAKIGEELNAAAITRGLGGDVKRTNLCQIGFKIWDWLIILICLAPYVIWTWSLVGRIL